MVGEGQRGVASVGADIEQGRLVEAGAQTGDQTVVLLELRIEKIAQMLRVGHVPRQRSQIHPGNRFALDGEAAAEVIRRNRVGGENLPGPEVEVTLAVDEEHPIGAGRVIEQSVGFREAGEFVEEPGGAMGLKRVAVNRRLPPRVAQGDEHGQVPLRMGDALVEELPGTGLFEMLEDVTEHDQVIGAEVVDHIERIPDMDGVVDGPLVILDVVRDTPRCRRSALASGCGGRIHSASRPGSPWPETPICRCPGRCPVSNGAGTASEMRQTFPCGCRGWWA